MLKIEQDHILTYLIKEALSNPTQLFQNIIPNQNHNRLYFNERTSTIIYEEQIDKLLDYGKVIALYKQWSFKSEQEQHVLNGLYKDQDISCCNCYFLDQDIIFNSHNLNEIKHFCTVRLQYIMQQIYRNKLNQVDYVHYPMDGVFSISFLLTKAHHLLINHSDNKLLNEFIVGYIHSNHFFELSVESEIIQAIFFKEYDFLIVQNEAFKNIENYPKIYAFLKNNKKFNYYLTIQKGFINFISNINTTDKIFIQIVSNPYSLQLLQLALNNLRKTNFYLKYNKQEKINMTKKILIYKGALKHNFSPIILMNTQSVLTKIEQLNTQKLYVLFDLSNIKQVLTASNIKTIMQQMAQLDHFYILKSQWQSINKLSESFQELKESGLSYSSKDFSINVLILIDYFTQYIDQNKISMIENIKNDLDLTEKIYYI